MSKLDSYKDKLINEYLEDRMSINALAKKYNCSRSTIKSFLEKNNIIIRGVSESNSRTFTPEIIDKIIYNYNILKLGLAASGRDYNLSQDVVKRILKQNGVYIRSYAESKQVQRKYFVNDDYFKTQTHNMAYILGLLAADGSISKNENGIFINLRDYDKQILEDINKEVDSTRPIKIYTRSDENCPMAKFAVWSSTWKQDLSVYGIVPQKTFILNPPYYLKKEYIISYIRGYFDGDGSAYWVNNTPCIKFCGASKKVLEWIRVFLSTEYNIQTNLQICKGKLKNNIDFYELLYYGTKARQLVENLYIPDSLRLERKYLITQTFIK